MEYYNIYNTILEKIDKVIEEDKAHPLLLIGNYRHGEIMHTDNSVLFDEFINSDDPDYEAMEVTPEACYSYQFEEFMEAVKNGCTFGDYQEFVLLGNKLTEFREEVEKLQEKDENPADIYGSKELDDVTRVWCNGFRDDVYTAVRLENEAFKELLGYLGDLSNLYVNAKSIDLPF